MTDFPSAPMTDVVLSCRVRLARNYADIPFSPMMTQAHADITVSRAVSSIEKSDQNGLYRLTLLKELSDTEKKAMVERHLISYDLVNHSERAACLISSGNTVSIMLNEEDHLRIQGLLPGLQLERAAELAFRIDDILTADQPIAFDSKWGYLTTCPANAGTGLRASALLHLPAITMAKQMGSVIQAVGKIGFTVRGLYGEGTEAEGNLFQLSNQTAMGRPEEDVIQSLIDVCNHVAETEKQARNALFEKDSDAFTDKMMRSVGILQNARLLDEKEFMRLFSDLRLAAGTGLIHAPLGEIDLLLEKMQPASLSLLQGKPLSERERMLLRAAEIRNALSALIENK